MSLPAFHVYSHIMGSAAAIAPVSPAASNDEVTMQVSMLLYGDGRLLASNVLSTTDYMLGLKD